MKPVAPSCERNRNPILAVLREVLPTSGVVLEIGSGTGQHAAWFSAQLPGLVWQPTDLAENLPGIHAWAVEGGPGLREPLVLDVVDQHWPVDAVDAVVCINAMHIISWSGVKALFAGVDRVLKPGGVLYVYGPYRYRDRPLEPTNEEFDEWLHMRNPESGIRYFEDVDALARGIGLRLAGDRAMPANNRSIWWLRDS
jgi:SAM-dependent methyltransferase